MTLRYALLFLAITVSVGCVHVEQTFTFHRDGSGLFELSYGMPQSRVDHMEHLASLAQATPVESAVAASIGSLFKFNERAIRREFADYDRHGVQLSSLKLEDRDGYRYAHLSVQFDSLRGLAKTKLLSDRDIALMKDDRGNYIFEQSASDRAANPSELPGMEDPDIQSFVDDFMSGFRVVSRVKTPAPIISSTAANHESTEVKWVFDFDSDKLAVEKVRTERMRVVFEGEGVSIPSFNSASL